MDEFGDVVETICSLRKLIDDIPIESKRVVLQKSFKRHIENFVFRMEEMYYKKIVLNRSITRLNTAHEKDIQQTFNTLSAFMPLMVAYWTCTNQSCVVDPPSETDVSQNDENDN